jgi:peroxiredoxin
MAWQTLPPQVGDQAPDPELIDQSGRAVRLSATWRDGPALVLFWRHWGCGCGTGRAERLTEEYEALQEAGATVVVVGQGEPQRATWYSNRFGVPCPILVDPTEAAYRAFGLLEMSPWLLLGEPKLPISEFERWIQEHRAKGRPVADNPFLLPGEFVVNQAGRIVLAYRYGYCDNYPDVETLVDSIHEAVYVSPA